MATSPAVGPGCTGGDRLPGPRGRWAGKRAHLKGVEEVRSAKPPERDVIECPGCGLLLPNRGPPPPPDYFRASAPCWALFGEMLAREFGDPAYLTVHQISVDTYASQHPGAPQPRSNRSVALHLMTLCLFLEQGVDPGEGPRLHKRMVSRSAGRWLEPPPLSGRMTVADVLEAGDAREHARLVRAWGRDVWEAWAPHHGVVREWVRPSLA